MNDDLDSVLARLAAAPTPASLADISDLVMARLHADAAAARTGIRIGITGVVGALALGVTGSLVFPATSPAAPLAPFGVAAALAPSTLLDGGR